MIASIYVDKKYVIDVLDESEKNKFKIIMSEKSTEDDLKKFYFVFK